LPILAVLLGLAELVSRSGRLQALLTPPTMGSRHFELGAKLTLLERIHRSQGKVDCLVMGSSMVDVGFDPEAFAEAYQSATGQTLQCFNFGIDGLAAVGSGPMADILVQDYRPRVLIYGTDARDYTVPRQAEETTVVLDSPWVQYRLGKPNLSGWLLEHSYLYRYRDHLSRLARLDMKRTLRSQSRNRFTALGFLPITEVAADVSIPPQPGMDVQNLEYLYSQLSDYEVRPENLAGLQQLLGLAGPDLVVIVVEMPVPPTYFQIFGHGRDDYARFTGEVSRLAQENGVPFWRVNPEFRAPVTDWNDYSHLNAHGARIFSQWLGRQVAEFVAPDSVSIPASAPTVQVIR
jgi:hypothetical protein